MTDTPMDRRRPVLRTRGLAGGRVEIRVIDKGPGITTEELSRLFDSFGRQWNTDLALAWMW